MSTESQLPKLKLTEWLQQLAATKVFNRETFANARQAMRLAANRLELYELGLPESEALQFLGWLSGDIPELRGVEVPRLRDSLERFRATRAGLRADDVGGTPDA